MSCRKPGVGGGDPRVSTWLASMSSDDLDLSVLVVGEIRRRVERLRQRDPAQAGVFEIWLDELQRHFAERVLPIDLETTEEWGRIGAGDPVPVEDGLMAATAKVRDMVFVTRNTADIASAFADVLVPRIAAGRVSICVVTELEMVYSARSRADHERIERDVLAPLTRVITPVAAETRAREIQVALVARGQHRAVAIPDLMVAAVALVEGLTVLHYDGDFDLIAAITGQPTEWVVPPGSA